MRPAKRSWFPAIKSTSMKIIALLFILSFPVYLQAQNDQPPPPPPPYELQDTARLYEAVEKEAFFPGGDQAWLNYIKKNFRVEYVSDIV
jgi:hypothetical protein